MPEEDLIPWSLPWLRYRIKKLGWRGVLILVVLAVCIGGTYDALRGSVADQIAKIFSRPKPPFSVTTEYKLVGRCNPGGWIMPEAAARAMSTEDLLAGPTDAPYSNPIVKIIVQGNAPDAVTLKSLKIVVGDPFPAAPTNAVWLTTTGCGSGLGARMFDVSIKGSQASLTAIGGRENVNGVDKMIPAIEFPFTVTNADPELFVIKIMEIDCDCAWHAELEWTSLGKQGTFRIDDDGKPFRTTDLSRLMCHPAESGHGPTESCELNPGL